MRLSVATNFQPDLVDGLEPYPVQELYGKLRQDSVGGGRSPYQLAPVSRRQLAEHVAHAHRCGVKFNYLLNASCMGNREITRKGQREIERLLQWLTEIEVDAVTVATPYMLKLIKRRFPHFSVRISLFTGVDRVRKAQIWEELGADCIVLDSILVNRELKTLEQIRKHVDCDLELLLNNNCLMGCALSPSHMDAIAHSSQAWDANGGFFIDWCFLKCTEMRLRDPVNYIRSGWIRPEDMHLYEDLGFDLFKVTERDVPTEVLLNRVDAYHRRHYDGNLLDLIQPYAFSGVKEDRRYYHKDWRWYLRFLIRPRLINPLRLQVLKKLVDIRCMVSPVDGEPPVFIDNRALDGVMDHFVKTGCRELDCDECGWCRAYADKAVCFDEDKRRRALAAYDEFFAAMEGGSLWRYLPGAPKGAGACARCED